MTGVTVGRLSWQMMIVTVKLVGKLGAKKGNDGGLSRIPNQEGLAAYIGL
jgi:hypothetical protein